MKGGRDTGDLLLSGDLMRVIEEDRRLLMQASGGCFRFVVDVERLSTWKGGGGKTDNGGRVYTGGGWAFRHKCKHNTHFMTLEVKIFTVTIYLKYISDVL